MIDLFQNSVGEHQPSRPDPVATQKSKNRSRPMIGRTQNFSGRDRNILWKIYQDIQLDESNLKFSIGSRPKKVQPGRLVPVANVFGSRSDFFLSRDPYSVATLKQVWVATSTGSMVPSAISKARTIPRLS
jgi:hypothetical protein